MDPELVVQTLNFHGQQLTKLWENERGPASLQTSSLKGLDYQVYQQRSKELGVHDRSKRIKVHQFIVDKAPSVLKAERNSSATKRSGEQLKDEEYCPLVPPFEFFNNFDKAEMRQNFFQSIRVGDVLVGQVQQRTFHGLVLRIITTDVGTQMRDLRDLGIKGSVHPDHLIAVTDRKDGAFNSGDLVRCEVIDVNADSEKLVCGMKGAHQAADRPVTFGIVSKEKLPASYRILSESTDKSYEECLQSNRTFLNPNAIEYMARSLGLDVGPGAHHSLVKGLNAPICDKDYADALRKAQNGKWATKSVAEGIKYFKSGQETEAFQCLNKALQIDACNVDGLVARGAL